MTPAIAAVIFDFDGLIIDTETPAYEAWAAIFREHAVELALERWVACVGAADSAFDPVVHLSELTHRSLDRAGLMADKERRKAAICNELAPLPGVLERLTEAEQLGLPLAVASSSSAEWVHGHLRRLGIHQRFRAIRTRGDVLRGKPFPDLYCSAAAALGVDPGACLVFEDSLNGVRAAKAAGARCFAIPNFVTRGSDFALADGVFASLAEVTLASLTRDR